MFEINSKIFISLQTFYFWGGCLRFG